jgi:hypothetical protein
MNPSSEERLSLGATANAIDAASVSTQENFTAVSAGVKTRRHNERTPFVGSAADA